MRRIAVIALTALNALIAAPAAASEDTIELIPAPGADKVTSNCAGCHSLDYVLINSRFLNAAGWDAEVTKMIKAFGAPIQEADARAIADYLKQHYGM